MKKLKKSLIPIIVALSLTTAVMLAGCVSNGIEGGENSNGSTGDIRYETEYKFEEVYCRIPVSGLMIHDGIKTTQIGTDIVESKYFIFKKKSNKTVIDLKLKATPDFSENLGSKWKKFKKQYGLADAYYIENFQNNGRVFVNDKLPAGAYRTEFSVSGMQCVKTTCGYSDGELISEESETVGTFAPYKEEPLTFFAYAGYDDEMTEVYSPYSLLDKKTVLLK